MYVYVHVCQHIKGWTEKTYTQILTISGFGKQYTFKLFKLCMRTLHLCGMCKKKVLSLLGKLYLFWLLVFIPVDSSSEKNLKFHWESNEHKTLPMTDGSNMKTLSNLLNSSWFFCFCFCRNTFLYICLVEVMYFMMFSKFC